MRDIDFALSIVVPWSFDLSRAISNELYMHMSDLIEWWIIEEHRKNMICFRINWPVYVNIWLMRHLKCFAQNSRFPIHSGLIGDKQSWNCFVFSRVLVPSQSAISFFAMIPLFLHFCCNVSHFCWLCESFLLLLLSFRLHNCAKNSITTSNKQQKRQMTIVYVLLFLASSLWSRWNT